MYLWEKLGFNTVFQQPQPVSVLFSPSSSLFPNTLSGSRKRPGLPSSAREPPNAPPPGEAAGGLRRPERRGAHGGDHGVTGPRCASRAGVRPLRLPATLQLRPLLH